MPEPHSIGEWAFGQSGQIAIAGLAGAAVNAALEWNGVRVAFRKIFVGSTSAFFLGPIGLPVMQWAFGKIDVPPESAASVGGFVMGLVGLFFVEVLIAAVRARRDAMLEDKDDEDPRK